MAETSTAGSETDAGAAAAPPNTETMTDRELAQAVLARTVRPRVADVRRLAEAVLAKPPKKKKAKSGTKKASVKKAKTPKIARKLAKIPGQKRKKA